MLRSQNSPIGYGRGWCQNACRGHKQKNKLISFLSIDPWRTVMFKGGVSNAGLMFLLWAKVGSCPGQWAHPRGLRKCRVSRREPQIPARSGCAVSPLPRPLSTASSSIAALFKFSFKLFKFFYLMKPCADQ